MPNIVSEDYKKVIYSGGATHKASLTINNIEISPRQIKRITISDPFIDNASEMFYLGQFISKKLIIEFKNMNNIPVEGEVQLSIGTLVNDSYEYVKIGTFYIDYNESDYYENCKLTCLDSASKMKTACDYSELIINGDEINPISLETLLRWICEHYGVQLGSFPETNKDYLISTYDNSLSGKYYISLIAELMGSMAHFDSDNTLNIIPIKQLKKDTINAKKSEEWKYTSTYIISKVIYDNGITKIEYGNDDNNTLFIRSDNMFVTDNVDLLIKNIYDNVNGTRIDSLKIKNYGDPSLNSYDLLEFQLGEDNYYTFNNNEIVYEMTIMSTIETVVPTKTQMSTTNVISNDVDSKVRTLQTTVNQQSLTLSTTAKLSQNNQERISKTELSVENIQNLFQVTGGNNLIKDSQLLLGDNVWIYDENVNLSIFPRNSLYPSSTKHPIEFYYSNAKYIGGYDAELIGKTTSISKIGIQNGSMYTSSDNIENLVIGKQYTLSYKVSNDENTVSKVKLIGNGNVIYEKTYNEKESFKEEIFSFIATTNKYTLQIQSTTILDGFVYIYDLMLNAGDTMPWEPASGEIVGTILKLSQNGLQIYCTGSDIATLMTAEGFQVRRYENGTLYEIVTEFTKDGFISKKGFLNELEIDDFEFKTIKYNLYDTLIIYKRD